MADESRLVVFAAPASQPSRAVYWTCLMRGLPFELIATELGDMGSAERIRRSNPTAQVPTIEDGDFALYEMPAILAYLAEKHGWDDLFPKDLHDRARVNQYLHFHHNWTRRLTMELMAPHVTIAFRAHLERRGLDALVARLDDPAKLETGRAAATRVADLIERGYFPGGGPYLCGDSPTIADIACYEETAQLRFANLFEFEGFAKIQRWLDAMAELPFHEPAHRYNLSLGDIRSTPNTMERFLAASEGGYAALEECGVRVTRLG